MASAWLNRSHIGPCTSIVHGAIDSGDCEIGTQGTMELVRTPTEDVGSWEGAAAQCIRLCRGCARCRYISVSLGADENDVGDCWWYHNCHPGGWTPPAHDKDATSLHAAFRSGVVRHTSYRAPWLDKSRSDGQSPSAVQTDSGGADVAAIAWLRQSVGGFCPGGPSRAQPVVSCPRGTCRGPPDACDIAPHGTWRLEPSPLTANATGSRWPAAAAACLALCQGCPRCRVLSISLEVCSWHYECDLGGLLTIPDGFRTATVSPATVLPSSSSCTRASGCCEKHPAACAEPGATRPLSWTTRGHEYGFLLLAYKAPCAVETLLHAVRTHHPTAPIFVHTDNLAGGGSDFSRLCASSELRCRWRGFARAEANPERGAQDNTAEPGGNAMRFFRRIVGAMRDCDCDFLVTLEDDVCMHAPIDHRPPDVGDVGGLPGPTFSNDFVNWVSFGPFEAIRALRPAVWGCTGACYYRTAAWLAAAESLSTRNIEGALNHGAWAAQYMDAIGPTLALTAGLRVWPWRAVSSRLVTHGDAAVQGAKFIDENVASFTTRLLPQDRIFEHKCESMLQQRARPDAECALNVTLNDHKSF